MAVLPDCTTLAPAPIPPRGAYLFIIGGLSFTPNSETTNSLAQDQGGEEVFGAGVSAQSQPPAAPSESLFQAPLCAQSQSCAGPCCSQVILSEADHGPL